MSESSKYHSFTAADIERYYKGQMPATERHALEKAALDDPFLADALEGYAFTSTPLADLEVIQTGLKNRADKKSIPLFPNKYSWLQVAAFFLVLAGAGWLLVNTDLFRKNDLALAPRAKETKQEKTTGKAPARDVSSAAPPEPQERVQEESHTTASAPVASPQKGTLPASSAASRRPLTASDQAETDKAKTGATAENNTSEVTQQTTLNSRNAYSNSLPPSAKTKDGADDVVNRTRRADSISAPAAVSGRAAGIEVKKDTEKTVNVTMQPLPEKLEEVIVVGKNVSPKSKRAVSRLPIEPAQGWEKYNSYITENLQEPEDIRDIGLSGEVELSFDITKEGEPTNIKVEKSLCTGCDAEAVRLVREGPKWKKKKEQKGRIAIHF
jgi:hypothetical protein